MLKTTTITIGILTFSVLLLLGGALMNTIPPSILQSGSKSPEPTVHLTASPTDTPKELVSPEPTISLFEDNPERFDDDNPGERHRRRRGKDY